MTSHCTEFIVVCVLLGTRAEFLSSEFICPTQLCKCVGTTLIDCTYKGLKTIPKFTPSNTSFYKLDFFEDLIFVSKKKPNNISTLYFESFKNITVYHIDLRSVRLKQIDSKAFAGVKQFLKVLYIEGDGRSVVNLPFLKELMTLEILHLENFGLTDVSEDNQLKELTSLKLIRIRSCINLTSLGNNTFVNMPSLNTIYIEHLPSLQTVPTAIQNLQSLMRLKIYNTSISHLDENSFKGITKLQSLHLQFFEGFFYNMSTLEVMVPHYLLDLSDAIEYLDLDPFHRDTTLTDFDLYGRLEVPFCQLLHSSGHPRLNLPHKAFWHLRLYLTHLYLGFNLLNLTDTYELIRSLSNLKVLSLSCIGLTEIPVNLFRNHSNLQALYLDNNNIKKLSPTTLYGLSGSLHKLFLNNNKLQTLYKCVLENFTQLQNLELKNNEWICDCHLIWLHDKIVEGLSINKLVKCTTPEVHKRRYLQDLSRSMLVCNDDYFQSDCPIRLDLNITTLSQTSLQLTWSFSDKYLLSGYLLEVTNLQNRTSTRMRFRVGINYYKLPELEPGTPYQICLLIVISETVKANLEACKTWEIQGPSSSKDRYQEETTSRTIIFKSLIVVGAVGFIITVFAITVILKTVSKKKAGIAMQLVLTEQYTSGCTTEATFSKSSCSLDSPAVHFPRFT